MSNILINSKKEQERVEELLKKGVPHYRQAYSDRMAWLMACMSELAYIRFNPKNSLLCELKGCKASSLLVLKSKNNAKSYTQK